MSTELNSIIGKEEFIKSVHDKTVGYNPLELHITSFNGGKERGTCLQITIDNCHIQLDKEGVIKLKDELTQWIESL